MLCFLFINCSFYNSFGQHVNAYCVCLFVVTLPQYLTKFQWDLAKYPIKQSLKNISDIISKVRFSHMWSVFQFYVLAAVCII